MAKNHIERRVDKAMNTASAGLSIPLSKLTDMGKLCRQALGENPAMGTDALVAKCRAIMVELGATEAP